MVGTSHHGDRLCRRYDFHNFELFSECVYASRGGARRIAHKGTEVTIGTRSMADFGLTYEGYDLPRDVYITDSGGHLRMVRDTVGRGGHGRSELTDLPYRHITGMLLHPAWWDMDANAPRRRRELGYAAMSGDLSLSDHGTRVLRASARRAKRFGRSAARR